MSVEARLKELQLQLPAAPSAIGMYRLVMVVGSTAFTSGHGPLQSDGSALCGCLGAELTVEQGYDAARQAGLAMLASLRAALGDLDRVQRLVKTLGVVRATPDFTQHPAVINGFSELMRDLLGDDAGIGARSAFGAVSLPAGWAVEVEAVFEIRP